MTGTAGQKRVPTEYFAFSPFPLPPLAEQHRIVAKVDELMVLCDELDAAQQKRERRRDRLVAATLNRLNNGNASLEPGGHPDFEESARFYFNHLPRLTTRPEHIQQLRQTILDLAVRGKLVEQDPNDEPASELLKRIEAEKNQLIKAGKLRKQKPKSPIKADEIQFKIPEGWAAIRIGEVGNASDSSIVDGPFGSSVNTKRDYRGGGIPVTRMSNISPFEYKRDNLKFIGEDKFKLLRRHNILSGDVLLGKVGSIGNAAIYPDDMQEGMLSTTGVARFRVGQIVSNRYLCILLNALGPEMRAIASQAVQPFLNMKTINNLPICIPPLAEQHRIVAKVDELMALCEELEAGLNTNAAIRLQLLDATLHESLYGLQETRSQQRVEAQNT
jgi:type I restriction enzyme S subunit